MKIYHTLFTLFAFIFSLNSAFAQNEHFVPLESNPVIKQYLKTHPFEARRTLAPDTLEVPFADDFSGTRVYPDPALWTDNLVYINTNFGRNPITLGVATFDGLDANGNAYDNANPAAQGSCDTLTSKPVFLLTRPGSLGGGQFSLADSITLSFYYEKKGWGDAPDNVGNDSLLIEFFNPVLVKWIRQWYAVGAPSGGSDTVFTKVQLRIRDAAYLYDGFRFRFRNYGSLSGNQDHWHIDYVQLYKAFNNVSGQLDTVLIDPAFTLPAKSLLNGYTSIPWDHFKALSNNDQKALVNDSIALSYRVNEKTLTDVGFNNRIYDYAGNFVSGFGAANGNIITGRPINTNLVYTLPVDPVVFPVSPAYSDDSTTFTIKNYFSNLSNASGFKTNDTVTYKQEFYNYYSYDDGSAELGFDLVSSANGKVAMRFDIIKPDTLRAIRIMFVQQLKYAGNFLMTLKVWSSLSPETVIYQQPNSRPVYVDSINGFSTYVLDQIVPVSGRIYVGFEQSGLDGLHLGYDRNTVSNDVADNKMFYYSTGPWTIVAPNYPGSFMIRPVMGDSTLFVGLNEIFSDSNVSVYPNPASDQLNLRFNHPDLVKNIQVYNTEGRLIKSDSFTTSIDLADFSSGLYLLNILMKDGSISSHRFIVTK